MQAAFAPMEVCLKEGVLPASIQGMNEASSLLASPGANRPQELAGSIAAVEQSGNFLSERAH
jgi:hypothetical protein